MSLTRCRGCLSTGVTMRNMYDLNIHEHFSAITSVPLERSEGLSELLCSKCQRSLVQGHQFRLQCQKSYQLLREEMLRSTKKTPLRVPGFESLTENNNTEILSNTTAEDNQRDNSVLTVLNGDKLTYVFTLKNFDLEQEITMYCPYNCTPGFAQRKQLLTHLVKKHGIDHTKFVLDFQFYCAYEKCPYKVDSGKNKYFSEKKTLKNHIFNVHKSKDIMCGKCNTSFAQEKAFERHKAVCEVKFVCPSCDIEYKTNERLLVHILRKHPALHKEYKRQKKEMKEQEKNEKKRAAEETTQAKKIKGQIENQSTQTNNVIIKMHPTKMDKDTMHQTKMDIDTIHQTKMDIDKIQTKKIGGVLDSSPKRFSTKTDKCVKNDITLNSCVAHSPHSLKHSIQQTDNIENEFNDVFLATSSTIETQTVFEDILSIRSQNSEDEIFETVSLSDIQTQTWPLEFSTKMNTETQTNPVFIDRGLTDSPDLSFKETQTCFCFLDSPKPSTSHFHFPKYLYDSAASSPTNNLTSTETQTAEASIRSKDVLLSFNSIETQTCEDYLDSAKLNI